MEYRITSKNQISAFRGLIAFTIFLIIGVWLVGISKGFKTDLFVFFGIFYIVNLIPVLFIHFQYYIANKNMIFTIELDKKQFLFKTNGLSKTINFSEVQKVDIYMIPSMYRGSNFKMLPFEDYHYAILQTHNEILMVTSLLVKNLVKEFKNLGINMERHQCFYPYIKPRD